jgi:hypothetical protein
LASTGAPSAVGTDLDTGFAGGTSWVGGGSSCIAGAGEGGCLLGYVIDLSVAVVVGTVADFRGGCDGEGALAPLTAGEASFGTNEADTETLPLLRGGVEGAACCVAGVAARGGLWGASADLAFVDLSVAVVVFVVADLFGGFDGPITSGPLAVFAELRARAASTNAVVEAGGFVAFAAFGCAREATSGELGAIDLAVAVVVEAIADLVGLLGGIGSDATEGGGLVVFANKDTLFLADALSGATGFCEIREVFVDLPVAIVVKAIALFGVGALVVAAIGVHLFGGTLLEAGFAGSDAGIRAVCFEGAAVCTGITGASFAYSFAGDAFFAFGEALIDLAVAVVIESVAVVFFVGFWMDVSLARSPCMIGLADLVAELTDTDAASGGWAGVAESFFAGLTFAAIIGAIDLAVAVVVDTIDAVNGSLLFVFAFDGFAVAPTQLAESLILADLLSFTAAGLFDVEFAALFFAFGGAFSARQGLAAFFIFPLWSQTFTRVALVVTLTGSLAEAIVGIADRRADLTFAGGWVGFCACVWATREGKGEEKSKKERKQQVLRADVVFHGLISCEGRG